MSSCQRILYDQCHPDYIGDVDHVIMIESDGRPTSPYGPLTLNPHSLDLARHIAQGYINDLRDAGYDAHYLTGGSYYTLLHHRCQEHSCDTISVMQPSEHTLSETIDQIRDQLAADDITLHITPNKQFLFHHDTVRHKRGDELPTMEYFYRRARKKTTILIEPDGTPTGGKRNYDKQNRGFDRTHSPVDRWQRDDGSLYPYTRAEALDALGYFVDHHLDSFGHLEDAMYTDDPFVYHSGLSMAMNFGLLHPREVIDAILASDTAINNKEGYIRQVLGWREYMYHRFWYYKDSVYKQNYFDHTRPLPYRFWEPENSPLRMHCVNTTLHDVKKYGYSHHITRLMIIGNFCLLIGYNPHDVNRWFWEMYVDAFEWVVTPNVLGMSQFADGGNLATKPYVASANYINKMSNYCSSCYYDPKKKTGERACPFNTLFRKFVNKNQKDFSRQPFIVANLKKIPITKYEEDATNFIASLTQSDYEATEKTVS